MGIVIGLIFALGCLSILAACTSEPNPRLTRLNEAMERNLRQAGVGKTSPAALVQAAWWGRWWWAWSF